MIHSGGLVSFAAGFYGRFKKDGIFWKEEKTKVRRTCIWQYRIGLSRQGRNVVCVEGG
jgi:hypothetical protein